MAVPCQAAVRVPSVGPDTVNTVLSVSPTAGGGDSSQVGTGIDVPPMSLPPDVPTVVAASLRPDHRAADRPMQSRRLHATATFRYVFLGFSELVCCIYSRYGGDVFGVYMSLGRRTP